MGGFGQSASSIGHCQMHSNSPGAGPELEVKLTQRNPRLRVILPRLCRHERPSFGKQPAWHPGCIELGRINMHIVITAKLNEETEETNQSCK